MATKAEIILSAKDATKAAFASIGDSFDKLQGRLGGIGGKLGALGGVGLALTGAFAALENVQAIKILDQLDDLAEKTGISVEKLSELRFAGESVGTPLAALATGISKLGKNMAEAAGGGKEAIATFQAIGVEIKNNDGTLRSSEAVLRDIADKFSSYEDGAAKAALAQKLFGKSGEDMIPILNLGSAGLVRAQHEAKKLGAIYGGDVAKSAADFNDNMTKIRLASEATAVSISGPLIKSLADLSTKFVETKVAGESVLPMLAQWVGNAANILSLPGQISLAAKYLKEKAFGDGTPAPKFADPRILGNPGSIAAQIAAMPKVQAPVVKSPGSGGAKGPVDDPTKKLLDNRLKELNRGAEEERELMASRNEFLNLYNEQGLISIADYYAQRQNILDEATRKQIAAYDAQIAALKDYQAKAGKDTDRAGAEGKINELLDKRAKVEREAGTQAIKFGIERSKAEREYADELGEVNAKLLELQGNLGAAAAIRFDKQFDGVLKLFSANGNAEGVAKLDILKKFTVAQADLSKVTQGFSLIQGDLQIAEDRITIARERGTMGEIQALQASGEARQRALGQMREQLGLLEKIDVASRTPEQGQAIDRLKVQVEQLAAAVDPLADRINTMFSDAATNALTGMFNGTLTPKEAARQFFNSVLSDVGGMLMKDLASKVFGGGESGGIGGLISRALGGGKGEGLLDGLFGGKSAGSAAAMTALTSTTTGATSALALLTSAASSAAAALQTTSLTGGGGGGLDLLAAAANGMSGDPLDNLIGLAGGWGTIPSFDVGTDFVPKDMLALIHKGERIVPASQNKPGRGNGSGEGLVIQIHQSVGDIATASMLAASNANLKRELAGAIQRNQRYGGAGS